MTKITLSDIQIGLKYNVTISDSKLAPIFGASHNGVILTSIVNYEEACKITDMASSMANAAVTGVVNPVNPKSETYLKFKTSLGGFLVLPMNYIDKMERLTLYKATITLNNISDRDVDVITRKLADLGYVDAIVNKVAYDVSKESYKDTTFK